VVERIEDAADVIQSSGNFPTPFSGDPPREIQSFAQQMIWRYTSAVTGDEYEQEDFAENVIEQFEEKTGVSVSGLPEDRRNELNTGIDDFWTAFQAVGVEAKVISGESPGLSESVLTRVPLSNQSVSDNSQDLPDVEVKIPDVMIIDMTDLDRMNFQVDIPRDTTKVDTTGCKDQDMIMRLIEVKGDTSNIIITLPDGTEVRAKPGIVVPENTIVTTGEEEELVFELIICKENDKIRKGNSYGMYKVRSNTEVKFDVLQLQGEKNVVCRVKIKTGEVRIKVTSETRDYRVGWKVTMPSSGGSVSGTDFIARTNLTGEEFIVNEGSVEVECVGHPHAYKVEAGKKIVIRL
jgi:hypothetical protein